MKLLDRRPPETMERTIARIGSGGGEIWYATFDGDDAVHMLRSPRMAAVESLALSRPGDRIRLTMRRGKVTSFTNLTLEP